MTTSYDRGFYADLGATSAPSAAAVWPLVLDLVPARSIVDLGCGDGSWLQAVRGLGVADTIGVDGPWIADGQLKIPLDTMVRQPLEQPVRLDRRFDLAMTVEVAEHLTPARAVGFVEDLTKLAPIVLFSAAIPGQGGTHHINEQWPSYWAALFARHGYRPIDCLRTKLWDHPDVAWWYKQNLIFFASDAGLAGAPKLAAELASAPGTPMHLVHPARYQFWMKKARPGLGGWLKMAGASVQRSFTPKAKRA